MSPPFPVKKRPVLHATPAPPTLCSVMKPKAKQTGPLARRVALVTGATRGIGLATAHALAKQGAHVAVASRTLHRAEALAKELAALYGIHALPIEMDVTKPPAVSNMSEKLLKKFQRIDLIVNNAGVMYMDQLLGADVQEFTEIMGTNVGGAFLVTRALVEEMMVKKEGCIINVAAMAGLSGAPYLAAYCASKAALIALTQSWAAELEDDGIRVYAVCPDIVDTDLVRNLLDVSKTPMLTPAQVADKIVDLAANGGVESGAVIPMETPG